MSLKIHARELILSFVILALLVMSFSLFQATPDLFPGLYELFVRLAGIAVLYAMLRLGRKDGWS
jgi:hypothetical protein